jgi:3-hydroxyacyl-CoA dehydrogenase/enoyl-CoA hydratase/3-hydroxybutyryl-CoA epimerase
VVQTVQQRCEHAYIQQGHALLAEGVKPAVIENAAFAAGLPQGPLTLANERAEGDACEARLAAREIPSYAQVRRRLLCSQALAAAACWEEGLTDPVKADLASILVWSFPSYTGGVLSYIDTLGLRAFISLCDALSSNSGADLNPSAWLRTRAMNDDRIYPLTA